MAVFRYDIFYLSSSRTWKHRVLWLMRLTGLYIHCTPLCMIANFQSWEINQQKLINHNLLHFEIYWLYCQVILFWAFFITTKTEMTIILHCYGCWRLAWGVCHVALQYSAPLMEAYSFQFFYYIDCFIVNLLRIRIEKLMRWSASPRKTPHFKWIDQFSSPCYALSQVWISDISNFYIALQVIVTGKYRLL